MAKKTTDEQIASLSTRIDQVQSRLSKTGQLRATTAERLAKMDIRLSTLQVYLDKMTTRKAKLEEKASAPVPEATEATA